MPAHSTDTAFHTLTFNQFVGQPLVISLAMIMGDEFRDCPADSNSDYFLACRTGTSRVSQCFISGSSERA